MSTLSRPGDRVDRRRAGVAAGRADDRQAVVAAREELLEQPAEQLQRDVLERERRAVEQLEQPVPLVELPERGDRGVGEAAVGLGAELAQLVLGQAVADERQHDARGELGVGQPGQRGDLALREARPLARQVEPAVGGEAGERDAFEIERRGAAAGGDVVHAWQRG